MKTKTLMSLAAAALLGAAANLSAAINYEYRAAEPTYGSAPGGTITVDLYFHEELNGSPSLLASESGLSDLTVRVTRTAGNATIGSATPNAAFADGSTSGAVSGGNTVATLNLHVPLSGSSSGVGVTAADGVYLGTISLTNGTLPSTFAFNTTGAGTITYANIYDLEATAASNGLPAGTYTPATGTTFNVLVPEPASIAALAGVGIVALRRRRA